MKRLVDEAGGFRNPDRRDDLSHLVFPDPGQDRHQENHQKDGDTGSQMSTPTRTSQTEHQAKKAIHRPWRITPLYHLNQDLVRLLYRSCQTVEMGSSEIQGEEVNSNRKTFRRLLSHRGRPSCCRMKICQFDLRVIGPIGSGTSSGGLDVSYRLVYWD